MAITKLMHMKEAKVGIPSLHLKNSIDYVLDVKNFGKKTGYGRWVGGNTGIEANEIYNEFMNTKNFFQKINGRQGYHFVISFPPGEADAQKTFDVAKEFCEKYFGDEFEYMFAVHDNEDHKHAHIIFNSVARTDGRKYRYEKGDWEKSIQPITDAVCQKYGLSKLEFEKEDVKPTSYNDWNYETNAKPCWAHIMRADIDYAIEHSDNFEMFEELMKKMNYELRYGWSDTHGRYCTYKLKGQDGEIHNHRSYNKNLGKGYSPEEIKNRIENKDGTVPFYKELEERVGAYFNLRIGSTTVLRATKTYYRAYQAVSFYKLPNPFAVPSYRCKKDLVHLEKLIEQCAYLKNNSHITDFHKRKEEVGAQIKQLYRELDFINNMAMINQSVVTEEQNVRYRQLKDLISSATDWSTELENAQDELEALLSELPSGYVDVTDKKILYEQKLESLKKEKRILQEIIKNEEGEDIVLSPSFNNIKM